MMDHALKEHGINLKHKCKQCAKEFAKERDLKRHVVAVHGTDKKFECHVCNKRFDSEQYTQQHIKSTHEGERKFECDLCGVKLCRAAILKNHQINCAKRTVEERKQFFNKITKANETRAICKDEFLVKDL